MPFSQMFDFLFGHWKMDVIIALWYKICKNGHVKKTDANICQFKKYSVNIIYRYPKWIAAIPRRGRLNCRNSVFTVWATQGVRWCALQGLEIMQVEILSGKELTNPPEVSFELLLVTAVAKRKQRDSKQHQVSDTLTKILQSWKGVEKYCHIWYNPEKNGKRNTNPMVGRNDYEAEKEARHWLYWKNMQQHWESV